MVLLSSVGSTSSLHYHAAVVSAKIYMKQSERIIYNLGEASVSNSWLNPSPILPIMSGVVVAL
jgi:hypothetical protein